MKELIGKKRWEREGTIVFSQNKSIDRRFTSSSFRGRGPVFSQNLRRKNGPWSVTVYCLDTSYSTFQTTFRRLISKGISIFLYKLFFTRKKRGPTTTHFYISDRGVVGRVLLSSPTAVRLVPSRLSTGLTYTQDYHNDSTTWLVKIV